MDARKVLIVDDDLDALKLIGLTLERQGFEIIAAANGAQAIQKALESAPDLIILDVMMPEMDGYEVAAQLRRHPATEKTPILMFTARTALSDKVAGFRAGADDYLTKPIHPKELVAHVDALLKRHARQAESEAEPHGHVTCFVSSKGGVGTTTLVLNTGAMLRRMDENARVVAVELQDGGGTMGMALGEQNVKETGRHLGTLLERPSPTITRSNVQKYLIRHRSGLKALATTPAPVGAGPDLTGDHARLILRYLSADFEQVLVDLGPHVDQGFREAVHLADLVIVTVEPNRIGLKLAEEMLGLLLGLGVDAGGIRLAAIHRVPALGTISRTMIEDALHYDVITVIPPAPDLAYEGLENGFLMTDIQPKGVVAQQVRRVAEAILAL